MLTKGERRFRRGLHLTIALLLAFTAFVVLFEPKRSAASDAATPPMCLSR